MLYVVLFLAVIFYAGLFMAWGSVQPHLDSAAAMLAWWRDVVFKVPDHAVMLILKEMIVLTFVYLVLDTALSLVRRVLQRVAPRPSLHDYPTGGITTPAAEDWMI